MASFRNFASCLLKNSENLCAMGRFFGGARRPIATSTIVATQEPPPKTDKRVKCTLIPGDGVGPELCESVKEVFKAVSVPVEFEELFLSEVHSQMSVPVEEAIKSIRETGVALRGPLMSPFSTTGELQTLNMTIRKELDLFANVVHVRTFAGVKTRHSRELDFVIIREQTEGEYSALEHESVTGVIECLKIVTREKSEKIAKFAFDYATRRGRKKVTAVHKANIMKLGDGLFLRSCEEVSKLYPQIKFDNMIIDNTCMQLVSHPEQFDVMVMPNLYGNIIDNLAAGIVGGAGLVPGASYSADCVIHEPGARHAFGEAVGKNIANPTAMLFCAVGLLRHVNLVYFANLISEAVEKVLKEGKTRTRDLGGYASTTEFTQAVIAHLPH